MVGKETFLPVPERKVKNVFPVRDVALGAYQEKVSVCMHVSVVNTFSRKKKK